jgi:hypothetical protein
MKWRRWVVFEIEADSLEDANEIWDDDGPEVTPRVKTVAVGDLENVDEDASER